ncbi:MAG: cell division protein FtsL [Coriobacteriia bacterium]
MGLPALRHEAHHEAEPLRPALRVVRHSEQKRPAPRPAARPATRTAARAAASAKRAYLSFVVLVGLVAVLGIGRVWLSAAAAQTSIEAASIESNIAAAQNEGNMLEVSKSALATPSRVEAVAVQSLGMARPTSSTSLDLASVPADNGSDEVKTAGIGSGMISGMLTKAMSVTAGEAQQLLVGDVGLSTN